MRRQAHCRQPLVFLFSVPFVESSDTVLAVQSMRHGHLWASSIRAKRHGNMSVASFASFSSRFSLSDCVFFCLPLDPLPSPLISCLWVLGVCSREDPVLGVITISSIARHGRLPARLQRKVSRDGLGEDPDLWVRVVTAIGRVLICLSFHGPFFSFCFGCLLQFTWYVSTICLYQKHAVSSLTPFADPTGAVAIGACGTCKQPVLCVARAPEASGSYTAGWTAFRAGAISTDIDRSRAARSSCNGEASERTSRLRYRTEPAVLSVGLGGREEMVAGDSTHAAKWRPAKDRIKSSARWEKKGVRQLDRACYEAESTEGRRP